MREKKHYTRERLAEMAGISSKFLYEIEHEVKGFSAHTLLKLSEALGTDVDFILFGSNRSSSQDELDHLCRQLDDNQKKCVINILKLLLGIPDSFLKKQT